MLLEFIAGFNVIAVGLLCYAQFSVSRKLFALQCEHAGQREEDRRLSEDNHARVLSVLRPAVAQLPKTRAKRAGTPPPNEAA